MLLLHIIEGADRGKKFELPGHEPQLIGRSTEALPISDETVSRRHAELTPDNGKWFVRDLDSSNGTYINGRPVLDREEVVPGDRIKCGSLVAVLEQIGDPFRTARLKLLDENDADFKIEAIVETSS
ncbi:MAG: FHA domain-containing protein, partial [Planctomycetota bacterium]|nr:FHA domain-containing protein [Planctomycetota bacterium]